jgi:winged helix DNA-binding protein
MDGVLTAKALNRATLARQMLLAREKTTALRAVERLVGMQAQLARPPYIGLWSRVAGFRAEDLTRLVRTRQVVRGTLMRVTLHLVSTKDYMGLRPLLQPMLSTGFQRALHPGLEVEPVVAAARACLEERPCTFRDLRALLGKKWPKLDERALGYAVRTHLPLVQVPTDTAWGWPGAAAFAVAESWIGKRLGKGWDERTLVLRYLAAFGPAGPRDVEIWAGLTKLRDAFEALRPKLRVFHDEKGRELFDLPKAPRPPADRPAPVRFLPDYDNLLLGHVDRTRVIPAAHRAKLATANLRVMATFLMDGFVAGTWQIARARSSAALVVEPFEALSRKARAELAAEGDALLRFAEPDARTFEVRFGPAPK